MKRVALLSGLVAVLMSVGACGGRGGDAAVPRPVAYPRVEIPDTAYRAMDVCGVRLLINECADVKVSPVENGAWIDVGYHAFASPRMYLTLTECGSDGVGAVLANRREREALNLGGMRYELTELTTPGGWVCSMSVARASKTTPVQILAHDGSRVLSGAMMFSLPDSLVSDPAVIAPVVDAVARDMIVMMKGLDDE